MEKIIVEVERITKTESPSNQTTNAGNLSQEEKGAKNGGTSNLCKTNLEILISQNDILPLLKKINKQSKLNGRQMSLSEVVDLKVKRYKFI